MIIKVNKYLLFASWEVRVGKKCAQGLEYTVFSYTDRRRLTNNVIIFSYSENLWDKDIFVDVFVDLTVHNVQ